MRDKPIHSVALQALVFAMVSASFANVYITQPVLPVLRAEFGIDTRTASYTVSAVILGIALSNLPIGRLVDRYPVKPIIGIGGLVVGLFGIFCSLTHHIGFLIVFRFVQGLAIPALTTCLAAYLSRNLPLERLNTVMGAYVSATVIGGLGGRLLGGWIHPPLHWRYAFVTASTLVGLATVATLLFLPKERREVCGKKEGQGFVALIVQPGLLRIYCIAFGAFFVFSALFNYLPFYLSGAGFHASTKTITALYLAYIIGIAVAPISGRLSNRWSNGDLIVFGTVVFGASIGITHIESLLAIGIGLAGICAGFFTIHAAAAGSMNRKLQSSRGRANALYILFYYIGGTCGITICGYAYGKVGWGGITTIGVGVLIAILCLGLLEKKRGRPDANRMQ